MNKTRMNKDIIRHITLTLLVLLTTLLAVGCTGDDLDEPVDPGTPILFDTYMGRAFTRAEMNNERLMSEGFGLFAYHSEVNESDDKTYTKEGEKFRGKYNSTLYPNFMYNTQVTNTTNTSGAWTYSPVKYWPNETGTDQNGAESNHIEGLSFFAYAPYTACTPTTGKTTNTTGITAFTKNDDTGDPTVTYVISANDADAVDLLWGVIPTGKTWNDVTIPTGGTALNLTAGLPYKDILKPKVGEIIKFNFRHALCKLTLGEIWADVKGATVGDTPIDKNTKFVVKSITISGNGIKEGKLNLNNSDPNTANWESESFKDEKAFSMTVSENLNPDIKYVGDGTWANQPEDGVLKTKKNIFKADTNQSLFLLPTTNQTVTIYITYYTITKDDNLKTGQSKVENTIHKEISIGKMQSGNIYLINISIGMSSVDVSAEVEITGWENGSSNDVDLPKNAD